MKIFDLTIPISESMAVWPGDPPVKVRQMASIDSGDSSNVSQIKLSVHTGTHIDAPRHFINSGTTVDQIPLEKLVGEVLVLVIDENETVISDRVINNHPNKDLLKISNKVLFKTKNSSQLNIQSESFSEDFVAIDSSGARLLAKMNLDLIGVDYLSIATYQETSEPHLIFLKKGIVLLEGINLNHVPGGIYDLYCLPLPITRCDGAPARVILIDRKTD